MKSLRGLSLDATRVTDAGLIQYLPEMPALQGLSLGYVNMSDVGLKALDYILWLEHANLRSTAISSEAIVEFMESKSHTLHRLDLSITVTDDETLAGFPRRTQLRNLSLSDTGISDISCTHIARQEWLSELNLSFTDISDDGVRSLADCRYLKHLELQKTKITDTSFIWLSDSKIEHLGVGVTTIKDAGIPALADFPELRSLELHATALTDKGLCFLKDASRLESLRLEGTRISNAGLDALLALPLVSLSLNPKINEFGLKAISQHTTLRRMAICNADATSWSPLENLKQLEVLLIDDSVEDFSSIRKMNQLKVLMLWGDRFLALELSKLRLALPQCNIVVLEKHERGWMEFWNLCREDWIAMIPRSARADLTNQR